MIGSIGLIGTLGRIVSIGTLGTLGTLGTIGSIGLIGSMRRGYHSPIIPIFPIFPINSTSISEINLLLEGVRLGLSQKKTPRDSTLTYSPRGLTFSDGPRMTPYHNKLLLCREIKTICLLKQRTHTSVVSLW